MGKKRGRYGWRRWRIDRNTSLGKELQMTTSRFAATLLGTIALASLGTVTLLTSSGGKAAAQQNPPACTCAPYTSLTQIGTNLVHCQCGAATCVVSEHITAQAKSYGLQCVK